MLLWTRQAQVVSTRRLDANDVRAEVCPESGRERTDEKVPKVEHFHTVQRAHVRHIRKSAGVHTAAERS
jgi:hypothetical protein